MSFDLIIIRFSMSALKQWRERNRSKEAKRSPLFPNVIHLKNSSETLGNNSDRKNDP